MTGPPQLPILPLVFLHFLPHWVPVPWVVVVHVTGGWQVCAWGTNQWLLNARSGSKWISSYCSTCEHHLKLHMWHLVTSPHRHRRPCRDHLPAHCRDVIGQQRRWVLVDASIQGEADECPIVAVGAREHNMARWRAHHAGGTSVDGRLLRHYNDPIGGCLGQIRRLCGQI